MFGPSAKPIIGSTESLTGREHDFLSAAFDAARSGDTERLDAWIQLGLPVNLTNGAGDTLLILAAYHGRSQTVRALLERGADTERVNDNGQTALAAATFRRSAADVAMLLDAGADPARGARSALQVAAFFGLDALTTQLTATQIDRGREDPRDGRR